MRSLNTIESRIPKKKVIQGGARGSRSCVNPEADLLEKRWWHCFGASSCPVAEAKNFFRLYIFSVVPPFLYPYFSFSCLFCLTLFWLRFLCLARCSSPSFLYWDRNYWGSNGFIFLPLYSSERPGPGGSRPKYPKCMPLPLNLCYGKKDANNERWK